MERARPASVDDTEVLAQLLHDFNTEFDTPTPGASTGVTASPMSTNSGVQASYFALELS